MPLNLETFLLKGVFFNHPRFPPGPVPGSNPPTPPAGKAFTYGWNITYAIDPANPGTNKQTVNDTHFSYPPGTLLDVGTVLWAMSDSYSWDSVKNNVWFQKYYNFPNYWMRWDDSLILQ